VTVRYGWRPEDRDVLVPPPRPDVGDRAWRRRNLVAGGTVLAVVALAAGIAASLTFASATRSPRAVAEAFVAANLRYDWRTSWELVCDRMQDEYGTVERWSRGHDEAIAGPLTDGVTVDVGDIRPHGVSTPQYHDVEIRLSRGDETHLQQLLVVEEDGGYRVCGGGG
jgi:hypothetical protein